MFTLPVITTPTFSDAKTSASSWLFEAKLVAVNLRDSLLSVPVKNKLHSVGTKVIATCGYLASLVGAVVISTGLGVLVYLAVMSFSPVCALIFQLWVTWSIAFQLGMIINNNLENFEAWVWNTLFTLLYTGV